MTADDPALIWQRAGDLLTLAMREDGPGALSQPTVVRNLCADLLNDDPRISHLLVAAAEFDVAGRLASQLQRGLDANSAVRVVTTAFGDHSYLPEDARRQVVDLIARTLGYQLAPPQPSPATPWSAIPDPSCAPRDRGPTSHRGPPGQRPVGAPTRGLRGQRPDRPRPGNRRPGPPRPTQGPPLRRSPGSTRATRPPNPHPVPTRATRPPHPAPTRATRPPNPHPAPTRATRPPNPHPAPIRATPVGPPTKGWDRPPARHRNRCGPTFPTLTPRRRARAWGTAP